METTKKTNGHSVTDFGKPQSEAEEIQDCWTEETILKVAKKIMKKLNIDAELYKGEKNGTE